MEIVSGELFDGVFGAAPLIEAASKFLMENSGAQLHILTEKPINQGSSAFLKGLNDAGLLNRVRRRQLRSGPAEFPTTSQ